MMLLALIVLLSPFAESDNVPNFDQASKDRITREVKEIFRGAIQQNTDIFTDSMALRIRNYLENIWKRDKYHVVICRGQCGEAIYENGRHLIVHYPEHHDAWVHIRGYQYNLNH